MDSPEFRRRLAERARQFGISVPDDSAERLESYFRLLSAWNEKVNLTALPLAELPDATIDRLFIEALVAATHLPPGVRRVLDVGSGGGSPAIPLAVAAQRIHLTLVESRLKKAVFLREALRTVKLSGDVITSRLEVLVGSDNSSTDQDLITIRAGRLDPELLRSASALLRSGGRMFLFLGTTGMPAIPPELRLLGDPLPLTPAASLAILTR